MKEDDFKGSKTGKLVWESKGMFYKFEPKPLPLEFEPNPKLENQVFNTALALGRLDGITKKLTPEEVNLLRMPFILKEAQLSSEIEGTRATLTDVYRGEKEKEKDIERQLDTEEIRNYAEALEYGIKELKNPLSEGLIKEMHKILLKGVRGHDKYPGEYKKAQNAIGNREDTLETAKFVPASPESTPLLMRNLIEYMNSEPTMNKLCRIALAHYQFEAIHPFRDGNGRLGRLLIMLGLYRENILSQPLLYISEYFNRNRSTYTDLLYEVSSDNKIEEWIMFFLKALEVQSNVSLELIQKLDDYKDKLHEKVSEISQSPKMHTVVNSLFRNPFIKITDVAKETGLTLPAASDLVHKLERIGVLHEITGKQTRKIFVNREILNILDKGAKY